MVVTGAADAEAEAAEAPAARLDDDQGSEASEDSAAAEAAYRAACAAYEASCNNAQMAEPEAADLPDVQTCVLYCKCRGCAKSLFRPNN